MLNQLQHKKSTEAALRSLLSRLTRDEGRRAALSLCVYGAVMGSPATCSVADIQAMIASAYPGATQEAIRDFLDSRLQGSSRRPTAATPG